MEECMREVAVRRTWSETQLVGTFGGHMTPGTPDGKFEAWDGVLTYVQVVRAPLVVEMSVTEMSNTLSQTVLSKVVKSKQWLGEERVEAGHFVIFVWLPFAVAEGVAEGAERLMERLQAIDPRFSLTLRVPPDAGALFPAQFATSSRKESQKGRALSESDVTTFLENDASDNDEDTLEWDITWNWDSEPDEQASVATDDSSASEGELEFEWDITWDWAVLVSEMPDRAEGMSCGQADGKWSSQGGGIDTGWGAS